MSRRWIVPWAHLAVLWALAVAQPLFDVLADAPEFFVARGNTRADILILAGALVLVPPTILLGVERLLPAGRPRRTVHALFVGVLAAVIALQFLNATGASSRVVVPSAIVLGALLAYAYVRLPAVPGALTVLSPVPLVVLALFLLFSPVSELVLPSGADARAGAGGARETPVVMIVFDELPTSSLMDRRGAIDEERYPSFAALGRTSTWYPNATTVADVTSAAVPALLSGERPTPDALPVSSDFPRNLFTLLGRTHDLEVEEPVSDLCPERLCGEEERPSLGRRLRALADDLSVVSLHVLLPDDLRDGLPAVDRTFGDFRGGGGEPASFEGAKESFDTRELVVERFLGEVDPGDPPATLRFLHVGLPHVPWQYLPSGRRYAVNGPDLPNLVDERWGEDRWLLQQAFQRHLLQLGYTDRVLGRLVSRLRAAGRWDDALVVVTADHGVAFQAGRDRRSLSRAGFPEQAGVPLFVKRPGQRRGRVEEGAALTIDIVPTIAEELGLELADEVDGRPLARPPAGGRLRVLRRAGGGVTLPFAEFVRMRDATVRRKVALFGQGGDPTRLFEVGPDSDLIGRPLSELRTEPAGALRAEVDGGRSLAGVGARARLVPVFVTGRLLGPAPARSRLLVAVGGRVHGSTYSFRSGDRVLFASLVPERALSAPSNPVELLLVRGRGTGRRVTRLGVTAAEGYRLVERGGSQVIASSRGRTARVRSGAVRGYVEQIVLEGGTVSVKGWSATPAGPAERVLVFADGRLVASARPTGPRPGVAEVVGPAALNSEYRASGAVPPQTRAGDLRVFGLRGGRASELQVLSP